MSNLLLGTLNNTSQTVLTGGIINLGSIYRKYCKKNACGVKAFDFNGNSISLQQQGFYHLTATLVGTGTEAGEVTVQLFENGVLVPGAVTTQTITTPATEFRTFVIDYIIPVNSENILCFNTTVAKTITLQNTGVGATFTNVVTNTEKTV